MSYGYKYNEWVEPFSWSLEHIKEDLRNGSFAVCGGEISRTLREHLIMRKSENYETYFSDFKRAKINCEKVIGKNYKINCVKDWGSNATTN